MGVIIDKPTFNADQLISSSEASKRFGELRKKAKDVPQFVTENGNVDTVVLAYKYYEQMYMRLQELEEKEEARILRERIDRLEKDPAASVSWRSVRRSGKQDEQTTI